MSVNILQAIANIVANPISELRSFYTGNNRANSMGDALEKYVKDVFAGTLLETNEQARNKQYSKVFSFLGTQNHPPDFIIKNGDAVEVKKIESKGAPLSLNSSYPKAKLFADSPMITTPCRDCEDWTEKDILYAVGVAKNNSLSRLFFVYGVDYAASAETYEKIRQVIVQGVNLVPDVEFSETTELGRVNRIDPLGITYLRIRGMWGIENPTKVFSYAYTPTDAQFEFVAVINTEKYNSFPKEDRERIEKITNDNFKISDIEIKSPDNPAILKQAKLITFHR
ncbi:MAG: NgoPII family restriction endonuclease [Oscillospiraceae bacterium]|nr:NgoPII family restriction endonuclease [Oscillospiraceae bacterium]